MSDARAPSVVAVVVTRDPGPSLDVTLASLASQDYEELAILVMVSGGVAVPSERVAQHAPEAFVRRLDDDRGFGAAVNEALGMVDGAAFFLLCHDDIALDPSALHILVEESFRSNAGVVSPKFVRWDNPDILLHVGMRADKAGAVSERVDEGEVDHGQHDAVRDIFVAPAGCTLVRADLLRELGGYDAAMVAMAEDLDLCWRAQIAGARVVVAPDARVRHLEMVAAGLREVAPPSDGSEAPSLQQLQRRHELRAVLKCYSVFHLIRVLIQVAFLNAGEYVVSLVGGEGARAKSVSAAWRWNLHRWGEIRLLRKEVKRHRTFPDSEVRKLQVRGSGRLSAYLSVVAHEGFDAAHGRTLTEEGAATGQGQAEEPELTGSVGLAFSEDADFDDLDDLGHRSGRDRHGRRRRRPIFTSGRSRMAAWIVVAVVLAFGTRDLFFGSFPLVGQLAPLTSWTATWHHFVSGWQPAGVGTTAPATPAFGFLGVVGTVLLGAMGLTQKVLVLGCIPLGAWGVFRLLRVVATPRGRLVGTISYLGLPLAYNALGLGQWGGLVAYAAMPFIVLRLARATGLAPFAPRPEVGKGPTTWRATLMGQILVLGIIESVAVAFAPAVAIVVLTSAAAIVVGSVVMGTAKGTGRALTVALGATAVTIVLCGPWVVGTLLAGVKSIGVFGLASAPSAAPSWGEVVRFATGPVGNSPLSWLLIAAAVLPLLIGGSYRLAWAGRLWTIALVSWILALVSSRGWTGAFAPSIDVLLAPAAVAVAVCIGLGLSAFEADLSGYEFGWRQVVSGLAVVTAVVGLLPVVAETFSGSWGLPATGYSEPLTFMAQATEQGAFRVLWLGDPRAMPLGGWSIEKGLAYATSENGMPSAVQTWAPAGPGPADDLGQAVALAQSHETVHLGRLLAPAGVRYIIVLGTLAPSASGLQTARSFPPPTGLNQSLLDQGDLRVVPGGEGFTIYVNADYVPQRAERSGPTVTATSRWPTLGDLSGWKPILPGPPAAHSYQGPMSGGTVTASYAPAGNWELVSGGRVHSSTPAYGWAAQFPNTAAGTATLQVHTPVIVPLSVLAEAVLWLALVGALVGRGRALDWWWQPLRRRRRKRHKPTEAAFDETEGGDASLDAGTSTAVERSEA